MRGHPVRLHRPHRIVEDPSLRVALVVHQGKNLQDQSVMKRYYISNNFSYGRLN